LLHNSIAIQRVFPDEHGCAHEARHERGEHEEEEHYEGDALAAIVADIGIRSGHDEANRVDDQTHDDSDHELKKGQQK
jgi:hypothetical protein